MKEILVIVVSLSCTSVLYAQSEVKLLSNNPTRGDWFGQSVAIDNDVAVVGSRSHQIHVFRLNNGSWMEEAVLNSASKTLSGYGHSIVISGDRIVVGAPQTAGNGGSVFVYKRENETWNLESTLSSNNDQDGEAFGWSVDISGNTIVVGSPYFDISLNEQDVGVTFVYIYENNEWQQADMLVPSSIQRSGFVGWSVGIDGDHVIVGGSTDTNEKGGNAYIYSRNGDTWQEEAILSASNDQPSNRFGTSVGISGEYAIVGAWAKNTVYVFERNGGNWIESRMLQPPGDTSNPGPQYGDSVSIYDNILIVGAPTDDEIDINSGALYAYRNVLGNWLLQKKILPSDGDYDDTFGDAVATTSDYTIAGAPRDDAGVADRTGSVYIYDVSGFRSLAVQNLDIGGEENLQHLVTHRPDISFDVFDSMGGSITSSQVQVSTHDDFSSIDMWDTGEMTATPGKILTTVTYEGADLLDGSSHYLRARIADGAFYSEWASLSFRMNSTPSVPAAISPISGSVITALLPLSIQNSTDAEIDVLTYDYHFASDGDFENIIGTVSGIEEGITNTEWTIGLDLPDNQQYWWQARAYDGYEYSEYCLPVSFVLNAQEEPPGAFSLLIPLNNEVIPSQTPLLFWEGAIDPDPLDEVQYTVFIDGPSPGIIEIDAGETTNYQITSPLTDNAEYQWWVEAEDLTGLVTRCTGEYFSFTVNTANQAPGAIQLVTPTPNSVEITQTPLFYWVSAFDQDLGDIVSYWLYYGLDSLLTDLWPVAVDSNAFTPTEELNDNARYWWKVEAEDLFGLTSASDTWAFWVNTELEPPNPFTLLSPGNGETLAETTGPNFTWTRATDNDPNDYTVYRLTVSDNQSMGKVVYSVDVGTDTTHTMTQSLEEGRTYFWQVDAIDTDSLSTLSETFSFTIADYTSAEDAGVQADDYVLYQNYPNPFNRVTTIKYTIPETVHVRLTIYNALGIKVETLVDGVMPAGTHTVEWDASDMASEIYLCRLKVGNVVMTNRIILIK